MLKAFVANIEDVEEKYRDLYEEADDGYVLKVEGIDDHPSVAGLRSAYRKEQERRKALGTEIEDLRQLKQKLPEDFDADEWHRLKKSAKDTGDPDKIKAVQAEYEKKLEEAKAENATLKEQIRKGAVERDLQAALESAGVTSPSLKKGATALLQSGVYQDDDGNVVMDTRMGPKPVTEAVKAWASTDEGKDFVSPARGAGAKGSDGRGSAATNPWKKETLNLTEQARILREDPQLAESLKAAARN